MPVSTKPSQPDESPDPAPTTTTAAAAAPVQPTAEQTSSEGHRYPLLMVKGDVHRSVHHQSEEVRLAYDGWRPADVPAPQRGEFLPPPRQPQTTTTSTTKTRRKA